MNTSSSPLSTQDERILAALSHITVLIPTVGLIAPILIWATQKEKSRYVAFQALQAAAFQLALLLLWFVGMGCYMISFFGLFFSTGVSRSMNSDSALGFGFILPFVIIIGMLLIMLIAVIVGVVAAVMTFQGKDFRYPIIANLVERNVKGLHTPSSGQNP